MGRKLFRIARERFGAIILSVMAKKIIMGIVLFWVIFITKEVFFSEIGSLELVTALKDIAIGVSAIVVAIQGSKALNQWRNELVGRTKFTLARKLARLVFEYEQANHNVRNPVTYAGESADREIPEDEISDLRTHHDEGYARKKRLEKLRKVVMQLEEIYPEASLLIGDSVSVYRRMYLGRFNELTIAIGHHFGLDAYSKNTGDLYRRNQQIMYGSPDDEFGKQVTEAGKNMTAKLKGYLG